MRKVGSVLLCVLLIGCLAVFTAKFFFGVDYRAVLSGSMSPDLPVGSLVVTVPVPFEDIKVGDDITYRLDSVNEMVVTHRVIKKEEDTITTQGISNVNADKPITESNILGRVILTIPLLGYLTVWLSSWVGKLTVISLILVILLVSLLKGRDGVKFQGSLHTQK